MGALNGFTYILLIASAVANALIGLLVFSRSKQIRLNMYFAGLSVSLAGWSATNIVFQIVSLEHKFVVALLSYAFAALLAVCFFLFGQEIDGRKMRWSSALVSAGVIAAVAGAIPGVLATGIMAPASIQARTPALAVYGAVLLLLMGSGLRLLFHKLRTTRSTERARIQLILMGLSVGALIGLLCNLVLPLLGTYAWVAVGPSGSLVFVAMTAYAIVRHKLFDIRFFVVRAVAYVSSIALLALCGLLPATWVLSEVLNVRMSVSTFATLSILSIALTLAYQYLKKVFDKLTLRIFYRQYYDPQDVLDRLGDVLVKSIDMNWLQEKSGTILKAALGVRQLEYWLIDTESVKELKRVKDFFDDGSGQGVVVLDELPGHKEFIHDMQQKNIAVIARLRTTHGELGYVALGFKESGGAYTQQDRRLLGTAADEIAISLQNALHFEEIQNFNKTLQARVERATHELRRTNQKLKQLDETKDEFITMASHQLRTPLTSVKGYLSMVLEGDAGKVSPNQRKLLEQSYASSQRMVYLISDLLNLSRLNTGKFVIEPSPVDLSEVVQAEYEQLVETAKSRELTLIYNRPASFPMLMLDETKTHQVVMNLIDNAIYYTPAGGTVTVSLVETPTAVEYTVKDTGIGVPKHVQHKLFSKFYRAANAQQARPDGTGLGLFMVRKVIAAQGGSIIFESQEGKGSTFGFRFNKAHHQPPADIPAGAVANPGKSNKSVAEAKKPAPGSKPALTAAKR